MISTVQGPKDKLKKITSEQIYGSIPERPLHLQVNLNSEDRGFAAGYATLKEIDLTLDFGKNVTKLPIKAVVPNDEKPHPVIIYLSFDGNVPGKFLPAEEIIERGYAIISLNCSLVSENNSGFKSEMCSNLSLCRRKKDAPGKLALWAWAVMRVVDGLEKIENIDSTKVIVAGHSLLGKAALLSCAFDERINCVIANDTLGMGSVKNMAEFVQENPYLFCPRFKELVSEGSEPDGHALLLKLCSDRHILVGVAEDDPRSNPKKELEYIQDLIASGCDEDKFFYRSRRGSHYLSTRDWRALLDYIDNFSLHY